MEERENQMENVMSDDQNDENKILYFDQIGVGKDAIYFVNSAGHTDTLFMRVSKIALFYTEYFAPGIILFSIDYEVTETQSRRIVFTTPQSSLEFVFSILAPKPNLSIN